MKKVLDLFTEIVIVLLIEYMILSYKRYKCILTLIKKIGMLTFHLSFMYTMQVSLKPLLTLQCFCHMEGNLPLFLEYLFQQLALHLVQ